MQTRFTRRTAMFLLAAVLCGLSACATSRWTDQTVYSRVGMKFESGRRNVGWLMYSTNHIGLPKHIPAGTKFTVSDHRRNRIELTGEDGVAVHIEFVPRSHPGFSFDAWLERQLSTAPVELPADLDARERDAIGQGRYEIGMSRAALFLSIGYPPESLTPNQNDAKLTYEIKRLNKIAFQFDDRNRISAIRN
ncbi:MAG TPA: hypothetical protein VF384_10190 [Planctomycetota bacterium]